MYEGFMEAMTAPIANVLIIAGVVFLLIAVVGNIRGQIEPGHVGRIVSGLIGSILVAVGILFHVNSASSQDEGKIETPAKIHVISGTYGKNCGLQIGNVTEHLASNCNGKSACSYMIDHKVIGDPARDCAKNYIAEWRCGTDSTIRRAVVSPEAGYRSTVNLTC